MEAFKTDLKDCYLIKSIVFPDGRGYFYESYNQQKFCALTGWQGQFVQDNQSKSMYGVVRGLHFQKGEHAQAKLVRVISGAVLDVVVDIRPESPSFGKSFFTELSEENGCQLFVPRGFAHGFSVISESAVFAYKCDNYYNKAAEGSIHPYDAELNINWQIPEAKALLSQKDSTAGSWKDYFKTMNL